jgi:hypothetical protein
MKMSDTNEDIGLTGCLALLVLMIYSPVVWGFVLVHFWAWFILPVFTTLPVFGLLQAIGLWEFATLSAYFTGTWVTVFESKGGGAVNRIGISLVIPWLVLLMGKITFMLISR